MTEKLNTLNYIDGYCERVAGGYGHGIGEPINVATNVAFLIVAIFAFDKLKKSQLLVAKKWDVAALATILFIIGIGSAFYHIFPTKVTLNLDVIPIALYIHLYIASVSKRVLGLNLFFSIFVVVAFLGIGILAGKNLPPETLNGTIMYAPTYAMVWLIVLMLFIIKNNMAKYTAITAVIWTVSLFFRTYDAELCQQTMGLGTHFIWHILNSVVLYRMLNVIIENEKALKEI